MIYKLIFLINETDDNPTSIGVGKGGAGGAQAPPTSNQGGLSPS